MNRFADDSLIISKLCGTRLSGDHWWSRRFEYPYAMQNIRREDVVIDAGCGVHHPFKDWLKNNCEHVFAVDLDRDIMSFSSNEKITYLIGSISSISLRKGSVDKIVCISVLEHNIPSERTEILHEFHRLLKKEGRVVLTVDVPIDESASTVYGGITLKELERIVALSGFEFDGDCDWSIRKNTLKNERFNIRCACCVLKKRVNKRIVTAIRGSS